MNQQKSIQHHKMKIKSISPQNVKCLGFMSGDSQLTAISHAPPMAADFSSLAFTYISARVLLFIPFHLRHPNNSIISFGALANGKHGAMCRTLLSVRPSEPCRGNKTTKSTYQEDHTDSPLSLFNCASVLSSID